MLDWAIGRNVGFSKFVSLGNKADVSESDILEFLADDPSTRVILGYVEGIDDGRRFLRAARSVTPRKPVIIVKAGATAAGARAASSHTGSLAGSDRAYAAAFRQAGVLRAGTVEDLFDLALGFAMQPLPRGDRLLILTNAGGPGILAADTASLLGIPLAGVSASLRERILPALPATASLANPVDIIGDARADRYRSALSALREEPSVDAVLVLLTPQAMTEPEETARATVSAFAGSGKTVFASFLGEATEASSRRILSDGGVPNYPFPERAVRTLSAMLRYSRIRSADRPGRKRPRRSAGKRGAPLGRGPCRGPEGARRAGVPRNPRGVRFHVSPPRLRRDERRGRRGVPGDGVRVRGDEDRLAADPAQDGCRGVRVGLRGAEDVARVFMEITSPSAGWPRRPGSPACRSRTWSPSAGNSSWA